MRKEEVQRYQREFEERPDTFYSFGADLVDAGSPNPCSRSPAARMVLTGRWQKAYEMWLKDGEFSRDMEELYLGFILASEKIVNKGKSAEVPMPLPKRVWSIAEYNRALRRYEDLEYRDKVISSMLEPGHTAWGLERNAIAALIRDNKPDEAERLYYEKEWDANDMAEDKLALIHTCAAAEVGYLDTRAMWHYYTSGSRPGGPVTFATMKKLLLDCQLLGNCQVWRKGFKKWQPVTAVKCFASFAYAEELPPPVPGCENGD
jgi:hypothetical protein